MVKNSVILLRSIDLLPDPRVEKYVDFFKEHNIDYILVGWNRSNEVKLKQRTIFFNLSAQYGSGISNLSKLVRFNFFLIRTLLLNVKKYKYIHACDFDTVIPALLIKLLFGKKVIFDIFDWYSDSRVISNNFLSRVIEFLEKKALKYSDYVIICDSERISQLPISIDLRKLKILPNIPVVNSSLLSKEDKREEDYYLTISYVGILGVGRGLENLLIVVSKNSNLKLNIAGFGELQNLVEKYANEYGNITYWGKVDYSESISIMKNSDIIAAMYYKINKNHIYAAPNKYFEGLFLGKPIITTMGTSIGNKTEFFFTGFVINESYEALEELLLKIERRKIIEYSENASKLWKDKYENYVSNFMIDEYLKMIES